MNNTTVTTLAFSSNPQPSTSNTLGTPTATQNQMQTQSQPQPASSQPQQFAAAQGTTQTAQAQSQSHPTHYPHQISGNGGPTATAPFLRDFSLVAEAAKRAQVAIVTRDLEGVSL
ncbi:uncharacterized protein DSM5745_09200 [Aspergillus mulundensis]|uniref:Uncharacterized protein n=1 Tax=Aspergillus mulundensis TaxID=1810919 RepID=A0A3D8R0H9_9EURO|nr:Uncharacterized protein DSM5745_09200 [Aspergillus mulundensis]RDW67334.1 Uncharacterized protein DSM5745_09200 [Aspergillus mulundensis]